MKKYLTNAEFKLMELIWDKGEISSNSLVKECMDCFDWKKSTTYTNLKKLVEKKMVCNLDAIVRVLVSREEYENRQRKDIIKQYFSNSLPKFVLTFIKEENLTKKDIIELEKMIEQYEENMDD